MVHEPFQFCEDFERFAEGLHSGLFDLLHTGVALLSKKGVFLYCNKAFLEMFGFSNDVIGKSVTDVFITGERGVMDVIRTEKPVISSSLTVKNERGISFRYPIHSSNGELCGVVIESIPLSLGKEKLQMLMDTIHNLEEAAQHFEQARSKHVGRLFTFADIVNTETVIVLALYFIADEQIPLHTDWFIECNKMFLRTVKRFGLIYRFIALPHPINRPEFFLCQ